MSWSVHQESLPRADCLRLLPSAPVAWVACPREDTGPLLVPVRFALVLDEIVFRTGWDNHLCAAVQEPVVTVGAGILDPDSRAGWWVTVTGQAHLVGDPLVNPGLPHVEAWTTSDDRLCVGVPVTEVSGYRLVRTRTHPLSPAA